MSTNFYAGVFMESIPVMVHGRNWRKVLRDTCVSYAVHETQCGRHVHVVWAEDVDDGGIGQSMQLDPIENLTAYIDYLRDDETCIEFFLDPDLYYWRY